MNLFGKLFEKIDRYSDALLAIGVLVAVGLMIVRIPPHAMDYFIAVNLGISVVVLLVALYIRDLLKFPAFPTVLLLTTLYRLALNVSSTRLILLEANAGDIIFGFGNVVVGGNFVVGGVVFVVLVLIQFIVIAKGAERVAEVGARFTLDAMPGKQSSIDFDLQQGLITPDQARNRRRELEKESKLYGAMDGAMKFVKGDAIAGIIISIVNIVGGLVIGVMQKDMSAGEAAQIYSILTIGDGLVSQLPALFTSVAAGIAVTRVAQSTEEKPSNLGQELFRQLIENPGALRIAGGLFLLAGVVAFTQDIGFPGPPFLAMGVGFVVLAAIGKIVEPILKDIYSAPKPQQKVEGKDAELGGPGTGIFIPPPLVVEFNSSLAPIFGKDRFDEPRRAVETELRKLRERLTLEFGFQIPPVEVVARSSGLPPNGYVLYAFDGPIWHGRYQLGMTATLKTAAEIKEKGNVECEEVPLPGKRLTVRLIPSDRVKELLDDNVDVKWSAFSFFLMSIDVAVRRNLYLFLGLQETHILLKALEQKWPELVQAVYPKKFTLQQVCDVLKHLLREQVPIGDLRGVLEAMARWTQERKLPEEVGEAVRQNLRRALYSRFAGGDGRTVEFYYLQPDLEQAMAQARPGTPAYEELRMNISDAAKKTISPARHLLRPPVLLVRFPELRWPLREEFERSMPDLVVLSAKDFPPDLDKKGLGVVMGV